MSTEKVLQWGENMPYQDVADAALRGTDASLVILYIFNGREGDGLLTAYDGGDRNAERIASDGRELAKALRILADTLDRQPSPAGGTLRHDMPGGDA